MVSVTRDDPSGSTSHRPEDRDVLSRARGGVLHRRAYYLYRPENERDYGQEAIGSAAGDGGERDDLVVVLAGYRDRMETFFLQPRHGSRVAHHIHFPDFDAAELIAIGDHADWQG